MIIDILALLCSILIGAFFAKHIQKKRLYSEVLLVLSAAYLLSVTVLQIIPEFPKANSLIPYALILGGIMLQMVLESLSKGVEHGHIHHQNISFSLVFGLLFHSFLEGIPLIEGMQHTRHTAFAIAIHNIPVAAILTLYLNEKLGNSYKKYIFLLLFALITPLGMLVGNNTPLGHYPYAIMGLVAGIFIHISTTILFENSAKGHAIDWFKLASVGIIMLLLFYYVS